MLGSYRQTVGSRFPALCRHRYPGRHIQLSLSGINTLLRSLQPMSIPVLIVLSFEEKHFSDQLITTERPLLMEVTVLGAV